MSKSQLLENYLNGVKTVRDAVEGLSPQQLKARPVAGKWSALEVVCHLADFEPIYADRMKRILSACFLLWLCGIASIDAAQKGSFYQPGQRVVFLG